MTKKEMFNLIATVNADNAEIVEFCNHQIDLLSAKSAKKTPTKTQKENEGIMDTIAEVLGTVEKATVSEVIGADARLSSFSNQKISALLRKMVSDGRVVKTIEGKKAYFALTA